MKIGNAFYIKLGRGGEWEADSISSGKLRFGWPDQSLEDINSGNWTKIEEQLRHSFTNLQSQATRALNGLIHICTSTSLDIWVTFYQSKLWWARLSTEPVNKDLLSQYRTTSSPWSDKNLQGRLLVANELPGKIAQLQAFRWTTCTVQHKDVLQRILEGCSSPSAQAIALQRNLLANRLTEAIQELHWKDFEILVDLVFRASGWIRISVLGQQAKAYDLELREPISGDRFIVQVKARAGLNELKETLSHFSSEDYRRIFFVVHSPTRELSMAYDLPNNIELISPETLAQRVIDSGLVAWLEEKVS